MKKLFKFEDYKSNYVMHCKTEEEAIEFCKLMHKDGRKWWDGSSYETSNCWGMHKYNTCYAFNKGTHSGINFFECNDYIILEWEDFTTISREIIVYKLSGYDVEVALEEMRIDYTEEQLHNIIEYIDEHGINIPWTEYMIPTIEMAIEDGVMGNVPYNPKEGDRYYYPCFDITYFWMTDSWEGNKRDSHIKKAVGVYRTKEEAIAKAKELWGLED